MKSSDNSDTLPAPDTFAKSDTAEGELLKLRVTACLKDRFSSLQGVHVTVFGTTVALRGKVPSKNDKRLLLECCRHIPGVMRVVNELIVADEIQTSR